MLNKPIRAMMEPMSDVLSTVASWLEDHVEVAIGRIIGMDGFGGRRAGEILAIRADNSAVVGELALGAANDSTIAAAQQLFASGVDSLIITVPVGDDEAVRAGLACGGSANVLVQRASLIAGQFFEAVANGDEVVLISDPATGQNWVIDRATSLTSLATGLDPAAFQAAQRMLTKGPAGSVMVVENDRQLWVEAFIPEPRLLVLGVAALSGALTAQAALMGWYASVFSETEIELAVAGAGQLGSVDGVVVLSHDIDASAAVLAAALTGRCGFVGALGSRHTQQARADRLRSAHGISDADLARVRGPVGLDLGARTPEETALAIVAEMLAVTRSRAGESLTQSSGPING